MSKDRTDDNIGSGNGLVLSGNKPSMLIQFYVAMWRH